MNLHIFNFEIFKNPQKFQKKNYKKIDKKQRFQEMGRRPVRARCHWSNISNEFVHVPLRFFFLTREKKRASSGHCGAGTRRGSHTLKGKSFYFCVIGRDRFSEETGPVSADRMYTTDAHTPKKGAHSTLLSVDS